MTSSAPVWPAELFKDLDRNGPVPLYFQVAQCLEDGIRDGVLPPGTRLENEISLAKRISVSRPTMRRAIQEVLDKGLLVRSRGVGMYHRMRRRGVDLKSAKQKIGARRAVCVESRRLHVDDGCQLLTVERVAQDNSGQVIELGNHCYRPDMHNFETTLVGR